MLVPCVRKRSRPPGAAAIFTSRSAPSPPLRLRRAAADGVTGRKSESGAGRESTRPVRPATRLPAAVSGGACGGLVVGACGVGVGQRGLVRGGQCARKDRGGGAKGWDGPDRNRAAGATLPRRRSAFLAGRGAEDAGAFRAGAASACRRSPIDSPFPPSPASSQASLVVRGLGWTIPCQLGKGTVQGATTKAVD